VAGRAIRVRVGAAGVSDDKHPNMARIHIEYVAAANRPSLLEAQLRGKLHKTSGRGKVLRLSLSRAVLELHGGSVDVGHGPHGAAMVTCWLPFAQSGTWQMALDDLPTQRRLPPDRPRRSPLEQRLLDEIDAETLVMRKKDPTQP
jgi:hypothetical protein